MTRTRRTLHVATGVVLWAMGSQAFAQGTPTNDLIFIVDRSGSIETDEWNLQVDGLLECICGEDSVIPVGSTDEYRVTVIWFAGTNDIAPNLDGVVINPTTRPQVCEAIDVDLRALGTISFTILAPALATAENQFLANADAISRMLVVSTDGGMEDAMDAATAADSLRTIAPGPAVKPGRSGFARRNVIRSADVGPSPTYPLGFSENATRRCGVSGVIRWAGVFRPGRPAERPCRTLGWSE